MIRNLDSILKVNERCIDGCAPSGQGGAAVYGVKEISVYSYPDQLQDSFRISCAFQSTGLGIRKLTVKESTMDLPQGNASE